MQNRTGPKMIQDLEGALCIGDSVEIGKAGKAEKLW